MPFALDSANPQTLAILLFALTYVFALLIHAYRGAHDIIRVSLAIAFFVQLLLYMTLYQASFHYQAMMEIGAMIGFGLRFLAAFLAGLSVKLVRAMLAAWR